MEEEPEKVQRDDHRGAKPSEVRHCGSQEGREDQKKSQQEEAERTDSQHQTTEIIGCGRYSIHWLLCMMILLALCQEVETVGESSPLRQKMMGVLAAGTHLTLAAMIAAF